VWLEGLGTLEKLIHRHVDVVRIPLEAWMFVCVLCAFILCLPRVEAGKNASTVIPASRKRRQKGNPVVSGETVPAELREG
jgi:hypothetical protein